MNKIIIAHRHSGMLEAIRQRDSLFFGQTLIFSYPNRNTLWEQSLNKDAVAINRDVIYNEQSQELF